MLKQKNISTLTKNTKIVIGIDMGGWTAKCAISDMEGVIYHQFIVETKKGDQTIPFFNQEIRKEVAKFGIDWETQVCAIGFGCVGPLSVGNQISVRAHKVDWVNYPAAEVAKREFKKPTFLLNDARAIAYGEWRQGAGKDYDTFAIFSLGNGIGGGLVLDGRLYEGSHNFANEYGHGGDLQNMFECQCKLKGCPEGIASANGIEKYFQYYIGKNPNSKIALRQKELSRNVRIKDVSDLIITREKSAWEAFTTPLKSLAQTMSIVIYTVDPQAILIGGGPTAMGQVLIDAFMFHLKNMVWPEILAKIDFRIAELKNDAGVVGVIENAIDNLKREIKHA